MNDEEPGSQCQEIIDPESKVVALKDVFEKTEELIEQYGEDEKLYEFVEKLIEKAA